MSEIVPGDEIEAIVGRKRHPHMHWARAVTSKQTLYILHSQECLDRLEDLRDCHYSLAMDRGIDPIEWSDFLDQAIPVVVNHHGWLVPDHERMDWTDAE